MQKSERHIEFENYCKRVIGLTITDVEYSEIYHQSQEDKPYYPTKFPNLHTVDFSIYLHASNNTTIEIYWDGRFYEFGVGIKINEPTDYPDYILRRVSDNSLWKKFIGTHIINIQVTWDTVLTREIKTNKTETCLYPQDMRITFSNDKTIFISASGFLNSDDDEVCGLLDNLVVTDDLEVARQVRMIV